MNNKCPKCGFELNENVENCPNCGNKVSEQPEAIVNNNTTEAPTANSEKKFCLHCGKQIDASNTFCPYCGANFMTGENGNTTNNNQTNNNQQNNITPTANSSDVTTAFVFSLIGLLCCAVFAIPGLIKANNCLAAIDAGRIPGDKRGMANAAKIISIISLVLWGIGIFINLTK